jgi:hypothetical protein
MVALNGYLPWFIATRAIKPWRVDHGR